MKLFFRKEGNGEPLIILHGLLGSSDNWISVAKNLAKKNSVYIPDLRNHGHSPHSNTHTYEDLNNDLAEFMDTNKIDKATLIGHSMGGKVAMYFASDYPDKVVKLIIADIAPKDYSGYSETSQIKFHIDILEAMRRVDFISVDSRGEIDNLLSEKIGDPGTRHFILKNIVRNKTTGKYEWRLNLDILYKFREEIVKGVGKEVFDDRKPIFAYPVIFIKGEDSDYIQPEDEILIRSIYPDAKIVTIPGAGHWPHIEQPELFLKAVAEYS